MTSGGSSASQRLAGGRGQVGHRGEVGGEPAEVVPGQLVGAVAGQPELGHRGPALGGGEVGQVARREGAPGRVEDEREGHDQLDCARCPVRGGPAPEPRPAARCAARRTATAARRHPARPGPSGRADRRSPRASTAPAAPSTISVAPAATGVRSSSTGASSSSATPTTTAASGIVSSRVAQEAQPDRDQRDSHDRADDEPQQPAAPARWKRLAGAVPAAQGDHQGTGDAQPGGQHDGAQTPAQRGGAEGPPDAGGGRLEVGHGRSSHALHGIHPGRARRGPPRTGRYQADAVGLRLRRGAPTEPVHTGSVSSRSSSGQ